MLQLASPSSFIIRLLLLLLFGCFGRNTYAGLHHHHHQGGLNSLDMDLLHLQHFQWSFQQIVTTTSNHTPCFASNYKSKTSKGSATVELKQRDSCTGSIKNIDNHLQQRLLLDHSQLRTLQTRIRKPVAIQPGSPPTRIPLTSGSRLQILNYVTTLQLGPRNLTVIVDTGSDLTWVQCLPCTSCYPQLEPLPSFPAVPCNTTSCSSLLQATGNPPGCDTVSSACEYYVSYGDGSSTSGELVNENLALGSTPVMDGFVFGCGHDNKGLFGSASGLMGLGRSVLSLVAQSSFVFGGVFSYCLPSGVGFDSSGSLTFGSYKNTTPVSYTDMVWSPQLSSFYVLNLTGISVGGVDLRSPRLASSVGILIDSGTIITRLPPSIYTALKGAFLKQFSGYPSAPGFSILDTCFDLSAYQEVNLRTLKLRMEKGVEVKVDVAGVMYFVRSDASQVCLAFASLEYEDEIPIIGNYQQKNLRVVYDTQRLVVGFAQEECSF